MFLRMKSSKFGSAFKQIDIKNIKNGIVEIDKNNYFKIIKTSSINFQLKSEDEQDTIIDTYEGFLNSTNFPIQILIRTRQLDIDAYINSLDLKIANEKNLIYKDQLKYFKKFIKELIKENKILSKNFYIIVPIEIDQKNDFKIIKEQLNLRVDLVSANLTRMGITSQELNSIEVIDLFYSFYNPGKAKIQPIDADFDEDFLSNLIHKEQNNK